MFISAISVARLSEIYLSLESDDGTGRSAKVASTRETVVCYGTF